MMRAYEYLPAGLWDARRQVDAVLLDYDERHRRRIRLPTLAGAELLLDLPGTVRLREGDGLRLEDGGVVRVCARPERLLAITAADPHALLRLAWHLGNRHLAVQILPDRLHIREDGVIAAMVRGLGGTAEAVVAPFDPEGGAYDAVHAQAGAAHGVPGSGAANDAHPQGDATGRLHASGDDDAHGSGHAHGSVDDHAHDHAHGPGDDHAHDHPHGPGGSPGNGHAHDH